MNCKYRNLIVFLLIFFGIKSASMGSNLKSQKFRKGKFSMGIALGTISYHGDLAQKYFNVESTGLMAGVFSRFSLSPYFTWRNQFSFGQIKADDANSKFYKERNLNFKSNIFEYATMFEFNFLPYGINRANNEFYFSPYAFAGVGAFHFDPIATYNGNDISLRNLQTENVNYNLIQPNVPFGMGIKFAWTDRLEIGIEAGYRRLFTDYLDDVSGKYPDFAQLENDRGLASAQASHAQTYNGGAAAEVGTMRGDNHLTDSYMFGNITFTYRFFHKDICPGVGG